MNYGQLKRGFFVVVTTATVFLNFCEVGFAQKAYSLNKSNSVQQVSLLDDLKSLSRNNWGGEKGSFTDSLANADIIPALVFENQAYGNTGSSLLLKYDVTIAESFCGYFSKLNDGDLSPYNYLSFRIKGGKGGEFVRIQLSQIVESDTIRAKVSLWDYLTGGPTTSWQKVFIPLDAFFNLKSRQQVHELAIVIEHNQSKDNNSDLSGDLFFDDFVFGSYPPGFVKIDHFDDGIAENALGGIIGSFSEIAGDTLYKFSIQDTIYNLFPKALLTEYDKLSPSAFGGVFMFFGGDTLPHYSDISAYKTLYFTARARDASTNAGEFKIELNSIADNDTINTVQIATGLATSFKPFEFELQSFEEFFSPFRSINLQKVGQFNIVYEDSRNHTLQGAVIFDEIELRADGYTGPDTISPPKPDSLALDGIEINVPVVLLNNTKITTRLAGDLSRLESLRLEYRTAANEPWSINSRNYDLSENLFTVEVDSEYIRYGLPLEMRVVAENYNGQESFSRVFNAIADWAIFRGDYLFKKSSEVFRFLRNDTGTYADAARFEPPQFHPVSVATVGMGLISLCIEDAMGWTDDAEERALQTIANMSGCLPGFFPERNKAGFFRHFIEAKTGKRAWNSEYSTIDTGILISGALFCKEYFAQNDSIASLANALYLSVDWSTAIADPVTGGIFRVSDSLGNGSGITLPFNEYMIVAWLAKNDFRNNTKAVELWNKHYSNPSSLPTSNYDGIEVLTDFPGNFLSGFVHQFPYYLCNPYTVSIEYLEFMKNAMLADKLWWRSNTGQPDYIWGFGAGASNFVSSGYNADNILHHPGTICSPHIIAGFIPVNPAGIFDLLQIYGHSLGIYSLPDAKKTKLQWRFSSELPSWRAEDVQGVDFSTMPFGLASHPQMLGNEFFEKYNNFTFPSDSYVNSPPIIVSIPDIALKNDSLYVLHLDNYVKDDEPFSALSWSANGQDKVKISIDSITHDAQITAPGFVGVESVVFTVTDSHSGSDTDTVLVSILPTSIEERRDDLIPTEFRLYQNFPNPFNISTQILFDVPVASHIRLVIYNNLGQELRTLVDNFLSPGIYNVIWDGKINGDKIVPSGSYFIEMKNENFRQVHKMLLAK